MPSKTIEEYLKTAKPQELETIAKEGQNLNDKGAVVKSEHIDVSRRAEQVSSKTPSEPPKHDAKQMPDAYDAKPLPPEDKSPKAEHLASHDRAKQGNAVDQALQSKQPDKMKEQDKSKEPEKER
jgi:hypothetical protein